MIKSLLRRKSATNANAARIDRPWHRIHTHRSGKWATFYAEDARDAQPRFFDHYLRNADTSPPPRIRLEVRESRTTSQPAARPTPGRRQKSNGPNSVWQRRAYAWSRRPSPATSGSQSDPMASWGWSLPEDLELIGPMQATLWIGADDTDDLDLFVSVEKWAAGRHVPFEGVRRPMLKAGRASSATSVIAAASDRCWTSSLALGRRH